MPSRFDKGEKPILAVDRETGKPILDAQILFCFDRVNLPRALEKRFLNPVQYRINYQLVPYFAVVQALLVLAACTLLELDEEKFLIPGICLLALMVALDVGLVLWIRRQNLVKWAREEADQRYDLDTSGVPEQKQYEIPYEGRTLLLTEAGLRVGEQLFYYGPLEPWLVTSHKFNRVWMAIQFGMVPIDSLFVPLSPELLKAIDVFGIPVANLEMLNYLRTHKENAIAQIYNTGTFRVIPEEK